MWQTYGLPCKTMVLTRSKVLRTLSVFDFGPIRPHPHDTYALLAHRMCILCRDNVGGTGSPQGAYSKITCGARWLGQREDRTKLFGAEINFVGRQQARQHTRITQRAHQEHIRSSTWAYYPRGRAARDGGPLLKPVYHDKYAKGKAMTFNCDLINFGTPSLCDNFFNTVQVANAKNARLARDSH